MLTYREWKDTVNFFFFEEKEIKLQNTFRDLKFSLIFYFSNIKGFEFSFWMFQPALEESLAYIYEGN